MFQDGSFKPLCQHPKHVTDQSPALRLLRSSVPTVVLRAKAITHPRDATFPTPFSARSKLMLTRQRKVHQPEARLISDTHATDFQSFPFQQFHVLFNSLFKVLFIFPSRYLFAIGLSPVFSFRWNLPPILSCIPKQPDSSRAHHKAR